MTESELYRDLGTLTKNRNTWEENIPYVASLLASESVKIKAKALWILGEMGLQYTDVIEPHVAQIALFLDSQNDLLRERALNALGRIGRGRFVTVKPWWDSIMAKARDGNPSVRLAFVWASENIATNTPDAYKDSMPLFAELLHDSNDKVRMEAPEMFRVIGKRRPQWVMPYLGRLQQMAENDANPVVRIHSAGAIRVANKASAG